MNQISPTLVRPTTWPLPKPVILLLCIAAPALAGFAMFNLWKESHPEAARYANRASWVVFFVYLVVGVALYATGILHPHHATLRGR